MDKTDMAGIIEIIEYLDGRGLVITDDDLIKKWLAKYFKGEEKLRKYFKR
jgi:hypothetical protein